MKTALQHSLERVTDQSVSLEQPHNSNNAVYNGDAAKENSCRTYVESTVNSIELDSDCDQLPTSFGSRSESAYNDCSNDEEGEGEDLNTRKCSSDVDESISNSCSSIELDSDCDDLFTYFGSSGSESVFWSFHAPLLDSLP